MSNGSRRSRGPGPAGLAALALGCTLSVVTGCSPDTDRPPQTSPPSPPAASNRSLPPAGGVAAPQHRASIERAERVRRLPVLPAAARTGKRVVYSQPVDVHGGEVLLAVAEFQITNDLGVNVYVGSQIVLTDRPTDIQGSAVTAANGENVTPAMHHGQQTKTGTYQVAADTSGTRFVNLVAWGAASQATAGDVIRVDAGYGRLSVLTW